MLILTIWIVSNLIHMLSIVLVSREIFWEYRWKAWSYAWGFLALGLSLMMVRRTLALLDVWDDGPGSLALLGAMFQIFDSSAFLYAYWQFSAIFHRQLTRSAPPIAQIVVDQQSVIIAWDAAAQTMFGWTADEAIGRTLMGTIIPARSWDAHRQGVGSFTTRYADPANVTQQLLAIAHHKEGWEFPVEATIAVVPQEKGGVHFHGSVRRLMVV